MKMPPTEDLLLGHQDSAQEPGLPTPGHRQQHRDRMAWRLRARPLPPAQEGSVCPKQWKHGIFKTIVKRMAKRKSRKEGW